MTSFVPNKEYLRRILLQCFIQKKSAAEAHTILVETYGEHALSETACRDWFLRFKNNDFDLGDKERPAAPKKFEDRKLEVLINEEPSQTLTELGKSLQIFPMKEESMSDTESPQDGSTSQAVQNNTIDSSGETPTENVVRNENMSEDEFLINEFHRNSVFYDVCNTMKQSETLETDVQKPSVKRIYECEICTKTFTNSGNRARHLIMHSGVRSHTCEICQKNFMMSRDLTRHMLTHSDERPYECEICKKTFSNSHNRGRHMRIHSAEKQYECERCKRKFTQSGDLSKHMRTHSGERPYECDFCSKKFKQLGHLDVHMRTHSDHKPYECEICKKKFTQKSNLTSHLKKHTKPRPHEELDRNPMELKP